MIGICCSKVASRIPGVKKIHTIETPTYQYSSLVLHRLLL